MFDFLRYESRFLFLVWWELPRYFLRKQKPMMAFRAFASEMCSYAFLWYMTVHVNAKASTFTLLLPLLFMRLVRLPETQSWSVSIVRPWLTDGCAGYDVLELGTARARGRS